MPGGALPPLPSTGVSLRCAFSCEYGGVPSVRPGRNAALPHPPSLVLTMSDGRQLEIGILHRMTSMNPLSINNVARDETVAAISAQLAVR